MSQNGQHSATDSAVGYYYQGMFALLLLLDSDDDARVSVETADDVVVESNAARLHQLKHSSGNPKPLTLKNDGFWKTVRIWCNHDGSADDTFVLITCALVRESSPLYQLTLAPSERTDTVVAALDEEAHRVAKAREQKKLAGKKLPFSARWPGCRDWLSLVSSEKRALLDRVMVVPGAPQAVDILSEVAQRLKNSVVADVRHRVAERSMEWWGHQVVLSLLGERDRWVSKQELLSQVHQLIVDHSDVGLPDDVSMLEPEDLQAEMVGDMVRQIELVNGGASRIRRAAVARWRVRTQRERWLNDDFSFVSELDEFDRRLKEHWQDRFGPMCDDCGNVSDEEVEGRGRELLDWSHHYAPQEVPPIRTCFTKPFLVQGTYQQLADELRVGWHPEYMKHLSRSDKEATSA